MLTHAVTHMLGHTHSGTHSGTRTLGQASSHTHSDSRSGTHMLGTHMLGHTPAAPRVPLQSSAPCGALHAAPSHPWDCFRLPPPAFLPLVRGPRQQGQQGCVLGRRGGGCPGSLPAHRAASASQAPPAPSCAPPPAWAIPSGSPLRLPGRRLALGGAGVSSARAEAPGRAREGAREGKLFAQEPRTRESQGPSPAEGRPGLPSLRVDWFLQNYCSGPAPFIQGPWPPHYGCRVALERGSGLAAAVFNPLVCQTNMRRSQRRLQGPKGEAEQRPATVATGRWTAKARPCPGPAGRGATHSPAALTGVSGLGPALS